MPAYKCKIAVQGGDILEKVIEAASPSALKETIAQEGGFLVKVEKYAPRFKKIKPKEFYSFNQEFLTLLRAGVPVVIAFDAIIEKQEDTSFAKVLKDIRNDISQGKPIATAFERYERIFSSLYIAVLRSGEASGNVPDAIEEYLEYFERSRQIRQKIRAAAVYPFILTVCSVFVVAFLIIFVVPAITTTFVESGAQLPFLTSLLLGISDVIRSYIWVILIFLAVIGWGIRLYLSTEKGRLLFDQHYLKLPFLGELSIIYATSLFASSLSTVLTGGIPLNNALNISKGVINNQFYKAGIKNAIRLVEQGRGFSQSLDEIPFFPKTALRMIAAGEEGGHLEKVLKDVARFYEKDVEAKLTVLASSIEPLLMVLMGFVVGFIMLAMYMPVFQMAGTIG